MPRSEWIRLPVRQEGEILGTQYDFSQAPSSIHGIITRDLHNIAAIAELSHDRRRRHATYDT